jgi:hypothetical protein
MLDSGEQVALQPGTVVVAVKSRCDGCAAYLDGTTIDGWRVIPLAMDDEIAAHAGVWASRELVAALDIRSAPFFVALHHSPLEVVSEGVPFDVAHLATLLPPQ